MVPPIPLTHKPILCFITDGDVHVPQNNALRNLTQGVEGGAPGGWEVMVVGIGLSGYQKQGLTSLTREMEGTQIDLTMNEATASEDCFAICEKFEELRGCPSFHVSFPNGSAYCSTLSTKALASAQVDMWGLLEAPLESLNVEVGETLISPIGLQEVDPGSDEGFAILGAGAKAFLNYLALSSVADKSKMTQVELNLRVVDQYTSLVCVEDEDRALEDLEPVREGYARESVRCGSSGYVARRAFRGGARGSTMAGASKASFSVPEASLLMDEEDSEEDGGAGGLFDDSDEESFSIGSTHVAPPPVPASVPTPPSIHPPTKTSSRKDDLSWVCMRRDPMTGLWSSNDAPLLERLRTYLPSLTVETLTTLATKASSTEERRSTRVTEDEVLSSIIVAFILASPGLPPFVVRTAKTMSATLPPEVFGGSRILIAQLLS